MNDELATHDGGWTMCDVPLMQVCCRAHKIMCEVVERNARGVGLGRTQSVVGCVTGVVKCMRLTWSGA
jgi:hypothetical protein